MKSFRYLLMFDSRKIWELLAILQVIIFLILLWTWPPVSLTFVVPTSEANYWSSLISNFENQNPKIQIRLIALENDGGDFTTKLQQFCSISIKTGQSICDVIYTDIIWVPEFASQRLLLDLSSQFSPAELSKFIDGEVAAGRYQNKLYRIPFRADIGLIYYRQDLLKAAGIQPPKTFEELRQIARELQQQGKAKWGYLWQGKDYEGLAAVFVEVLQSYDGFWVNPSTLEVGLDRKEAIAALNYLISTLENKISPPEVLSYTEENSLNAYLQSNAVFLRNWPWVWAEINRSNSPIRDRVGILPIFTNQKGNGGGCKGSWGLGIDRHSKHPDAATKLIKYLTSETAQRQFILETGYLPSIKDLFTDPEIIAKYNHFPELLPAIKTGVFRPQIPKYSQASEILQEYLSAALRGQLSPEQALELAADKTRKLLLGNG